MQVDTSVAEADVGRLQAGHGGDLHGRRLPRASASRGTVRQIRNAPQTVQNVVTYDAVIDVDNPDLKLKPGMTANVTFVYAEKDDVLRVPNAALRFQPPPGMLADGGAAGADRPARASGQGAAAPARGRPAPAAAPAAGRPARGARDAATGAPSGCSRAGQPAPVRIRTGISDGTFTEVRRGRRSRPGDRGDHRRRRAAVRRRGRRRMRRPRSLGAAMAAEPLVQLEDVTKVYRMGDVEVRALRRRVARPSSPASSSPSWAPRARASPR